MYVRLGLLSLVVLPACAVSDGDTAPALGTGAFATGSVEELERAEALAWEALESAADSPATAANVAELRTLRVKVDATSMAHTKVQQLIGGVPVWGGEAIVHLQSDGSLFGFTDTFVPHVNVDTIPEFDEADAVDLAVDAWPNGWSKLTNDPRADLWVLRHEGADHLVWRVQLHQVNRDADDAIPVLFVDAHDGSVVWSYNNLQTATCTGDTNYYGNVSFDCYTDGAEYYLEDTTDLLGTYSWANTTSSLYYVTSTSTAFPSGDEVYTNAVEAHWVSQQVHTYYATTHGRNGLDGAGGPAYITSHGANFLTSTTSFSTNYVNASWDPVDQYMTYGDGDGTSASSLTTLDIAGHEMTHGVTQYEANLTYSGEPGHINEAMSDIMGTGVEWFTRGETAGTWLVGDEAWTPGVAGDALRYMDDPANDGYSRDFYTSSIGSVDVHYGSGVANLAFYLLSEGGTHPRGKSTTVVTGIGIEDATEIFYLALTSYMTSSTNYAGARTATLNAAAALFGTGSVQHTSVGNAWTAVGVNDASACTTSTYSGSLARTGRDAYHPGSSGTSVTATSQTASLTGPSSANFDIYLQKKVGRSWSNVASSAGSTSTESLSYSGTSGTYRTRVYSRSGSGSYTLSWCR